MSDFLSEPGLSYPAASKLDILKRDGKSPDHCNLIRWSTRGARDRDGKRVLLERRRTPYGYVTSEAAIRRFLMRLDGQDPATDVANTDTRSVQIAAAEREMVAAGLL